MIDWIQNRIGLARNLHDGNCGGSYTDAVIILASVISGVAARTWPGAKIDRKRFVEVLVRFCPDHLNLTRISVPLLLQRLSSSGESGDIDSARSICEAFGSYSPTHIVTGDEADKSESEILQATSELQLTKIRGCSYASLFYKEVRCGLVHEYRLTRNAATHPMVSQSHPVSYVNVLDGDSIIKSIHFEYEWIEEVVKALHDHANSTWHDFSEIERPHPWWIDGGGSSS